jgi:hypothetical protein
MVKEFNVTGLCFPEDHYMADVSEKVDATYKMIETGKYFIINRPRQYGKTTMLYTLTKRLMAAGQYIAFNISFEGIGDLPFESEEAFAPNFIRLLSRSMKSFDKAMAASILEMKDKVMNLTDLSEFITHFAESTDKKLVVLIDEVDKSSNNQLFVSFLAMLRNKYLERKTEPTFHSVVLAGVHDVKSLKLKISPDSTGKYNSPWNIGTEFDINMHLNPVEIKSMLDEYVVATCVKMDTQGISDRLYYFTSGYPYLVSKLCKTTDEKILPTKTVQEWTATDVNNAANRILREPNNANFDTVMKNLESYPELDDLVYRIVINAETIDYSDYTPVINLGVLHGILARSEMGKVMIHNRIYRELIGNMMIGKWRTTHLDVPTPHDFRNPYLLPQNGLHLENVLLNFQTFMKQQFSSKDREFLEKDGRLIFLAFLKPIINGGGYDFKEPQVSEEKRLDVVITYYQHQYVVELKIWHGTAAHEKGVTQLADYLDRLGLKTGFLVIFDHSKRKSWQSDWIDVEDKRIFFIRV